MLKNICSIKMQNQHSLDRTRLSMALVDLPLTPIGMKNRFKKKLMPPSGKENYQCKPTSLQKKSKSKLCDSDPSPEIATSAESDHSCKRTRESIYTEIDEGSFVEFYQPWSLHPKPQNQMYYTCHTNNSTEYSTSTKKSTAFVGFRQYVDAFKTKNKIQQDDTIISGAIANTNRKATHQVLNSTSKNGSFWNYDFPDISSLSINSKPAMINEEVKSIITLDDSVMQECFTNKDKVVSDPHSQRSIIEENLENSMFTDSSACHLLKRDQKAINDTSNTFITEDASICSSIKLNHESRPHEIVDSRLELSPFTQIADSPCSPKRDVLTWIITSPFKTAENDKKGKTGIYPDLFSQNLSLRLSESSILSSKSNPNRTKKYDKSLLTVGPDATSFTTECLKFSIKSNVDRRLVMKNTVPLFVPDSEDQSSASESSWSPSNKTNQRRTNVIYSSSSSCTSDHLTNVRQIPAKLLCDNVNSTNEVKKKIPLRCGSKISLHTIDNLNESLIVQRGEKYNLADSSDEKDGTNIKFERKYRPCNRISSDDSSLDEDGMQSSDDESKKKCIPNKSNTIVILSSSDISSDDDSDHIILDSEPEDDMNNFSNLREKLLKLIKDKPTTISGNTPRTAIRKQFTSPGVCKVSVSNKKVNDNAFNTSSSEDDCSFINKKRTIRKQIKPIHAKILGANNEICSFEPGQSRVKTNADKTPKVLSFLSSLSKLESEVKLHPDAIPFLKNFNKIRVELGVVLYSYFNEHVFDSRLPTTMNIKWNPRMSKTAGFCYYQISKSMLSGRDARIELSSKVIDSADRLRDTLIHEMCHAASWILSGYKCGHGPLWKAWSSKAMSKFPELPAISRCHSYNIVYKYTYQCTKCGYSIGRHSKSLDVEKKACGRCYGSFKLLVTSDLNPVSARKTPRTPGPFAMFVKENYSLVKKQNNRDTHGNVMKELSKQFNLMKLPKQNDD